MTLKRRTGLTFLLAQAAWLIPGMAHADVVSPLASEGWTLDDNCHAEGLAAGDARCFSKRWVPESVAADRMRRAMSRRVVMAGSGGCDGQPLQAYSPDLTPGAMGADDLQTAYRLPTSTATGAGKIVAIVDACGYSTLLADLNTYRKHYGIPAIKQCGGKAGVAPTKGGAQCVGIVSQTGTASLPADDSNWAGETALDVQMVSAACPDCSILVVQANSASPTDLPSAVAKAVELGADGVSNSWGHTESGSDPQLPSYPGVVIAAASGDADYLNEIGAIDADAGTVDYTPQAPNWPASDPNVLGVGGTTLTMDAASSRCFSDVAWSHKVSATSPSPLHGKTVYGGGSGCSTDYSTPSYQQGLAMGSCQARGSVDVSAAADFSVGANTSICVKGKPCGGIAVYGGGGWSPSVGTSAATPFVTAVLVRMGLGPKDNSFFYSNTSAFIDVTQGNNDPSGTCTDVMCNAGKGWDGPTGWGVPDGYALAVLGGDTGVVAPPKPTCAIAPPVDAGADSGDNVDSGSGGGSGGSSGGGSGGSSGGGSGGGSGGSSGGSSGSSGGSSGGGSGGSSGGGSSGMDAGAGSGGNGAGSGGDPGGTGSSSGCSTSGGSGSDPTPFGIVAAIAVGAIVARRRRHHA